MEKYDSTDATPDMFLTVRENNANSKFYALFVEDQVLTLNHWSI